MPRTAQPETEATQRSDYPSGLQGRVSQIKVKDDHRSHGVGIKRTIFSTYSRDNAKDKKEVMV
jgi:hypothetical protein